MKKTQALPLFKWIAKERRASDILIAKAPDINRVLLLNALTVMKLQQATTAYTTPISWVPRLACTWSSSGTLALIWVRILFEYIIKMFAPVCCESMVVIMATIVYLRYFLPHTALQNEYLEVDFFWTCCLSLSRMACLFSDSWYTLSINSKASSSLFYLTQNIIGSYLTNKRKLVSMKTLMRTGNSNRNRQNVSSMSAYYANSLSESSWRSGL